MSGSEQALGAKPRHRVALVTGASAGLGVAIARALGEIGWSVGLGARRPDRLEAVAAQVRAVGGTPFVHPLDVADPDSVDRFFGAVEAELGAVEVVISNAGVCIPNLLHEARVEDLQLEVATNLLGPMVLARRAIPGMLERGEGELVFITSDTARAPRPFQVGYGASKAGVENLVRTLAMELEGSGIRATAIRMGPTATEFGSSWDPRATRRILESWRHFGLQRDLAMMPVDAVARTVVHSVTAPPGTNLTLVELQPEAEKISTAKVPAGD